MQTWIVNIYLWLRSPGWDSTKPISIPFSSIVRAEDYESRIRDKLLSAIKNNYIVSIQSTTLNGSDIIAFDIRKEECIKNSDNYDEDCIYTEFLM